MQNDELKFQSPTFFQRVKGMLGVDFYRLSVDQNPGMRVRLLSRQLDFDQPVLSCVRGCSSAKADATQGKGRAGVAEGLLRLF